MNEFRSLLPPNSTQLERDLEQTSGQALDLPNQIRDLWSPERCPAYLLPWLAWALSISDEEGWSYAESEQARRNLISRAADIHRHKGTIWSIREVFRLLGLGEIEILENVGLLRYDGTKVHDGLYIYGGDVNSTWATYTVILNAAITNDQAAMLRRILEGTAPARSELVSLEYQSVPIRYNKVARYDGTYNYGSA